MSNIKTKLPGSSDPLRIESVSRILIVEDEPSLLSMYKTKFEREGFEVYSASDGKPGLEMAKKYQPDIILLDIVLNDMDGFTALEKLKKDKVTQPIPVIILSNLGTEKDLQYGLKLGACDYLIKAHTTPAQLVEKVKHGLVCRV